jgi:KDO2-lipid IV(A) lauroyltransferase
VVTTGFLGAPARVDVAPALVAMRARVPLVVAFPRRTGDGLHTVDIVSIFSPPRRPTRAWAESATIEATKLLEHFVRRHPEQWLWMHRRWKTSPNGRRASGSVSRLAGESP